MRVWTLDGPDHEYVTLSDAAKYLGVSQRTVRRLVTSGHLPPPVRVGRGTGGRFKWLDLVAYLHLVSRGVDFAAAKPLPED